MGIFQAEFELKHKAQYTGGQSKEIYKTIYAGVLTVVLAPQGIWWVGGIVSEIKQVRFLKILHMWFLDRVLGGPQKNSERP